MKLFFFLFILAFISCSKNNQEEEALCRCLNMKKKQEINPISLKLEDEKIRECVKTKLNKLIVKIKAAPSPKNELKESLKKLLDTECADILFQEIDLEDFLNTDLDKLNFFR